MAEQYYMPNGICNYCRARDSAMGILRALVIVHPNVYLTAEEIREICREAGLYDESFPSSFMWLRNSGILVKKGLKEQVPLLLPEKRKHYWQLKPGYVMAVTEFLNRYGIVD